MKWLAALVPLLFGLWAYGVVGLPATQPDGDIRTPSERLNGDAPVHVLFVGTSLTAYGGWVEAMPIALDGCSGRRITVEKLAAAGESVRWGEDALRNRLQIGPAPDIVVVEFSVNDASIIHGLPLFMANAATRRMIADIRATGAIPYLSTMHATFGIRSLSRLGHARYIGAYRDIAKELDTGLIDSAPAWAALPEDMLRQMIPDGVHPDATIMSANQIPATSAALCQIL